MAVWIASKDSSVLSNINPDRTTLAGSTSAVENTDSQLRNTWVQAWQIDT
jgi:hypothetical protein